MNISSIEQPEEVLPHPETLAKARKSIYTVVPLTGIEDDNISKHLHDDSCPGLNNNSLSSRYYGFVTGGATTASKVADNIVTQYDQNVQVHLPNDTIATDVEHHALNMLCQLIDFNPSYWPLKTIITGATASNIMGLASGREYIISHAASKIGKSASVAQHGLLKAMRQAELDEIQILTTAPHSSIPKAASIIGLGHESVHDCGQETTPCRFDIAKLTSALQRPRTASIIMISSSEVNTGMFATSNLNDMETIRRLADDHGAWIHTDAAFGFMARCLPSSPSFQVLKSSVAGLELTDSLTADGHKLFNVPYDTGFFLSRHLELGMQVFQNPNAAYLSAPGSGVTSPLHIGIENSRRFRALPVYANLVAYGRQGYGDMMVRLVTFARTVAEFLDRHPGYDVYVPKNSESVAPATGSDGTGERFEGLFIIVLFRARDEKVNEQLVQRINATRKIYCSGTKWEGKPAARLAVSNWMCTVEHDFETVRQVLNDVIEAR